MPAAIPAPRHPPPRHAPRQRAAAGGTAEVRTKTPTATSVVRILPLLIDALLLATFRPSGPRHQFVVGARHKVQSPQTDLLTVAGLETSELQPESPVFKVPRQERATNFPRRISS